MKCEIKKVGDVTLFNIQGDTVFYHLKDIRETIHGEIARSSTNKFLIDLGSMGMIDSAGVGFIISVYKIIVFRQGTFAIVSANEGVSSVLHTVGLTRLFKIYASEDEAIKAI